MKSRSEAVAAADKRLREYTFDSYSHEEIREYGKRLREWQLARMMANLPPHIGGSLGNPDATGSESDNAMYSDEHDIRGRLK